MTNPRSYSVLLTNVQLDERAGTECTIRDLAIGLLRRGHRPIVYSPVLGEIANEIRMRGVAVIDDLRVLAEPPDIIHGHHFIQTAEALISFPRTPAIFVCHAWEFWVERPPKFPQIEIYAAVSEAVRDRLVHTEGIDPAKVLVFPNAVDLSRVPPRKRSVAPTPQRALCFADDKAHVPILRSACERLGIEFTTLGRCGDRATACPERELVNYDLVFATGRCAIEALCCGAATIVCDSRGFGGLVTSHSYANFRKLNFALRALTQPNSTETVIAALKEYDPSDTAAVAELTRRDASFEARLDELLDIYRSIVSYWSQALAETSQTASQKALLDFLHEALPRKNGDARWPWQIERDRLTQDIARLDRECAIARTRLSATEAEIAALRNSRSWRTTAPLRRLKQWISNLP